jgi:SAM-dependent methyltransferase
MSSLTDSVAIFNYHRGMINTHGRESSFALGWKDVESQQIRFKALAGIDDLSGCSALDAGCGYGDFLPYLSACYKGFAYTGMEQIPELLKEAVVRYGKWPAANFIQGNFNTTLLPAVDYVFASGSLNYRSADPEFIFKAIDKLYGACNYGFAFNLLNHIVPNGLLVAYDPAQIISYCSSICQEVKLIQDYDPNDFTVYMYKQKDRYF